MVTGFVQHIAALASVSDSHVTDMYNTAVHKICDAGLGGATVRLALFSFGVPAKRILTFNEHLMLTSRTFQQRWTVNCRQRPTRFLCGILLCGQSL